MRRVRFTPGSALQAFAEPAPRLPAPACGGSDLRRRGKWERFRPSTWRQRVGSVRWEKCADATGRRDQSGRVVPMASSKRPVSRAEGEARRLDASRALWRCAVKSMCLRALRISVTSHSDPRPNKSELSVLWSEEETGVVQSHSDKAPFWIPRLWPGHRVKFWDTQCMKRNVQCCPVQFGARGFLSSAYSPQYVCDRYLLGHMQDILYVFLCHCCMSMSCHSLTKVTNSAKDNGALFFSYFTH